MPRAKLLRILKCGVLLPVVFISSACGGPNAYLCTNDFSSAAQADWHLFCVNLKTGHEKNVLLKDANKYVSFSPADYKTVKQDLEERCK